MINLKFWKLFFFKKYFSENKIMGIDIPKFPQGNKEIEIIDNNRKEKDQKNEGNTIREIEKFKAIYLTIKKLNETEFSPEFFENLSPAQQTIMTALEKAVEIFHEEKQHVKESASLLQNEIGGIIDDLLNGMPASFVDMVNENIPEGCDKVHTIQTIKKELGA